MDSFVWFLLLRLAADIVQCSPAARADNWESRASTLRLRPNQGREFPYVAPVLQQQRTAFRGDLNSRQEALRLARWLRFHPAGGVADQFRPAF